MSHTRTALATSLACAALLGGCDEGGYYYWIPPGDGSTDEAAGESGADADADAPGPDADADADAPGPDADADADAPGPDADADADADVPPPTCIAGPSATAPDPAIETCNYMDWKLEADGFYKISRFGTSDDPTTWGRTTTCGYLQGHYDYHDCVFDNQTGGCVGSDHAIPWVQGTVDYDVDTVLATVDAHLDGDVPAPEYFYVAGAQRFHCGSTLRVTAIDTGRCVVAYAEDGGPGSTYEGPDYGARRILDSSPAVVRYLQVDSWGWRVADLVYVEWGLPGDVPGQRCTRCASSPAAAGYPFGGSPFDPNHMLPLDCREPACGDGVCGAGETATTCPADCSPCATVPAGGRTLEETDPCFARGGTPGYWHTEAAGSGGALLWTYATSAATPDNVGTWTLNLAAAGSFEVAVHTPAPWSTSRRATYQVTHGGTTDRVTLDQAAVNGWQSLGRFAFPAGESRVRLEDNTGEPYSSRLQLVFDALRLSP
jgi:hypothetical protein